MTEERLQEIKEQIHNKISKWPYQALVVRNEPLRVDIISGPPVSIEEAKGLDKAQLSAPKVMNLQNLDRLAHKHVVHVHHVNPAWFEQNENYIEDSKFFQKAPEIVDELVKEVEYLKDKLCQCGVK